MNSLAHLTPEDRRTYLALHGANEGDPGYYFLEQDISLFVEVTVGLVFLVSVMFFAWVVLA